MTDVNFQHISVGRELRGKRKLFIMALRMMLMKKFSLKKEKAEKGIGTRGAKFLRRLNLST